MPDAPDELTLMAYLNGDCSPDDRAAVEGWMASDPANRVMVERLRAAWNPPAPSAFDPGDRLRRHLQRSIAATRPSPRVSTRRLWRMPAVAAALVTAAAGVFLAVRPHAPPHHAAPAPIRDVATPRGQRAAFNLADGTRVTLDADSRLVQVSGREVSLVGRALFQVVHDSTRSFRVRTASGVVEDLGTEFVVSAYPEEPTTQVLVASGAVAVRSPSALPSEAPLATLGKGEMASIDGSGVARMAENVDVASELAWTEGRHVFRRTPVAEVLAELGRWYDVELRVSDPVLLQRRLTASFGNQPTAQVLEMLSVALGVRVERRGRVVTLIKAARTSLDTPSTEQ
jgi:transmembrane sensor